MNNFFIPNQKEQTDSHTEYYTIFGKHDDLDTNANPIVTNNNTKEALAKKVTSGNSTKYYIKIGPHGKIYNPIGLYTENQANKFLARAGKNLWEFRQVNSKVFDLYVSFLRTKNIAWLNNAEREML